MTRGPVVDFEAERARREEEKSAAAVQRSAQAFLDAADGLLSSGDGAREVSEGLLMALAEILAQTAAEGGAPTIARLYAEHLPGLVDRAARVQAESDARPDSDPDPD